MKPPRQPRCAAPPAELVAKGALDLAAIKRRTPLGRLAEGQDIADAVVYLAGAASPFVTGALLTVDGGGVGLRVLLNARPRKSGPPEAPGGVAPQFALLGPGTLFCGDRRGGRGYNEV